MERGGDPRQRAEPSSRHELRRTGQRWRGRKVADNDDESALVGLGGLVRLQRGVSGDGNTRRVEAAKSRSAVRFIKCMMNT